MKLTQKNKVINMIEWKLRAVLRKVKSKNPQKRYEALDQLFHYKRDENIVIQVDVLKEIFKTAAFIFPLLWVRYELFYYHMKQHTLHLNKPPYIQS